ncbi:MAG: hypothetical protein GY866_40525 [Proteobacteria bacterium]|nr:hypothetical protein [Pseudomonadota bacterium]
MRDRAGNLQLPYGAFLKAREWAKFGEFLRLKGNWQGRQLISADLLDECLKGSVANPVYGLTFWLSSRRISKLDAFEKARINIRNPRQAANVLKATDPRLPEDLFMAAGAGKQRLYVIPSLEMVVVRQGEKTKPPFKNREFLSRLLF